MTSQHRADDTHLAPAQWFVRMLGLATVAGVVAALIGTRYELKRYLRIKKM